jgi:hypothetical protein
VTLFRALGTSTVGRRENKGSQEGVTWR